MEFSASAPCKAILFGEHYVVYGAPALSIAIEPRNTVKFSDAAGGEAGIALLSGAYGKGRVFASGSYSGAPELAIYAEVAKQVFGAGSIPKFSAEFFSSWKIKGAGASASLCAAFAAGCLKLAGRKPNAEDVFFAAQSGDLLAHGGNASGIDAKTVSYGKPLVFRRSFLPPAFRSSRMNFSLPPDCSLLLVDTNVGRKDRTADLIARFAKTFGIASPPHELPEKKRLEVQKEYLALWERLQASMKGADGETLGKFMNENHALLKARGVSSVGMEKAVSSALASGAYGAKLTGAGGEGGAILVLCGKKDAGRVAKALNEASGFSSYPVSLAKKGACVD